MLAEEEEEEDSRTKKNRAIMADDEAEIYDGIRAQFPLTFGKQSKGQTPLEAIHRTTRRGSSATDLPEKPSSAITTDLPSLSSSSKTWLNSLRNPKAPNSNAPGDDNGDTAIVGPPPPPATGSIADEDDGGDAMIGPPRPPQGQGEDDDEDVMVGPPRPPVDDGEMIGPPRPPGGSNLGDSDSEEVTDDEEENRYRIPLSNEIVLKGHTKVLFVSFFCLETKNLIFFELNWLPCKLCD